MVFGAQRGRWYAGVRGLALTPDEGSVAYVGVDEHAVEVACIDDRRLPAIGDIDHSSLRFSSRGRLAYMITGERSAYAVDGVPGPSFESIWSDAAFVDEDALAFIAREGDEMLYVHWTHVGR